MRECGDCGYPRHFVGDGSFTCDLCGRHNKPVKRLLEHPDVCGAGFIGTPCPGLDDYEGEGELPELEIFESYDSGE